MFEGNPTNVPIEWGQQGGPKKGTMQGMGQMPGQDIRVQKKELTMFTGKPTYSHLSAALQRPGLGKNRNLREDLRNPLRESFSKLTLPQIGLWQTGSSMTSAAQKSTVPEVWIVIPTASTIVASPHAWNHSQSLICINIHNPYNYLRRRVLWLSLPQRWGLWGSPRLNN